jgi:hypothetical protein
VVIIDSRAGFTVTLKVLAARPGIGVDESVTLTLKLLLPGAVGTPVRTPVAGFRLSPAGRLPEVIAHVYGPTPPVAERTAV